MDSPSRHADSVSAAACTAASRRMVSVKSRLPPRHSGSRHRKMGKGQARRATWNSIMPLTDAKHSVPERSSPVALRANWRYQSISRSRITSRYADRYASVHWDVCYGSSCRRRCALSSRVLTARALSGSQAPLADGQIICIIIVTPPLRGFRCRNISSSAKFRRPAT